MLGTTCARSNAGAPSKKVIRFTSNISKTTLKTSLNLKKNSCNAPRKLRKKPLTTIASMPWAQILQLDYNN
jgi:hypothetical protein